MKFNLFFTIKGQVSTIEAPNTYNPQEAENLKEMLKILIEHWESIPLRNAIVGIRIEEAKE